MANVPYPLTASDIEDMRMQVYELIRQVFEEKIGGADLGDVFSLPGDVLTLIVADASGLTKTNNELAIEPVSTGGMQVSEDGLAIKILSTGGLETTASGLGIKLNGTTLTLGASGISVSSVPTNYIVVNYTTDEVLDITDLGKIHIMDVTGGDRTFTLPDISTGQIGKWIILARKGGAAISNRLILQTVGNGEIYNSGAGGRLESNEASYDYQSQLLIVFADNIWCNPNFGIWYTS